MNNAPRLLKEDTAISLEGALQFGNVMSLQVQGQKMIDTVTENALNLNLAGLTYCDSAGLALLLDWLRYAKSRNIQLSLINSPVSVKALASLSELDFLFTG